MLAEMDDVLAQGYIQALVGDAQVRRLRASLQALTGEREGSISAGDVQRLLHEQLRIEQATRRLRASLAAMRAQFVRLGGAQLMSS